MGYYSILIPQVGYLSNVRLKSSPANGVTQADLDAAQGHAKAEIDAALAAVYDVGTWEDVTPPIIGRIADMLSSSEVLDYKYQRGDTAGGSPDASGNLPEVLSRDARALLEMIRRGAISLVGADGTVQARLDADASALPEARIPEARFFPDSAASSSFGRRTSQSLEEVYRTREV